MKYTDEKAFATSSFSALESIHPLIWKRKLWISLLAQKTVNVLQLPIKNGNKSNSNTDKCLSKIFRFLIYSTFFFVRVLFSPDSVEESETLLKIFNNFMWVALISFAFELCYNYDILYVSYAFWYRYMSIRKTANYKLIAQTMLYAGICEWPLWNKKKQRRNVLNQQKSDDHHWAIETFTCSMTKKFSSKFHRKNTTQQQMNCQK